MARRNQSPILGHPCAPAGRAGAADAGTGEKPGAWSGSPLAGEGRSDRLGPSWPLGFLASWLAPRAADKSGQARCTTIATTDLVTAVLFFSHYHDSPASLLAISLFFLYRWSHRGQTAAMHVVTARARLRCQMLPMCPLSERSRPCCRTGTGVLPQTTGQNRSSAPGCGSPHGP